MIQIFCFAGVIFWKDENRNRRATHDIECHLNAVLNLKTWCCTSLFVCKTCSTTWLVRIFYNVSFCKRTLSVHIFFRLKRSMIIRRGLACSDIGNEHTCASEYDTATPNALLFPPLPPSRSLLSPLLGHRNAQIDRKSIFSVQSVFAVAHVPRWTPASSAHMLVVVHLILIFFPLPWLLLVLLHRNEKQCYVTPNQLKCSLYSSIPCVCARCVFYFWFLYVLLAVQLFEFKQMLWMKTIQSSKQETHDCQVSKIPSTLTFISIVLCSLSSLIHRQ